MIGPNDIFPLWCRLCWSSGQASSVKKSQYQNVAGTSGRSSVGRGKSLFYRVFSSYFAFLLGSRFCRDTSRDCGHVRVRPHPLGCPLLVVNLGGSAFGRVTKARLLQRAGAAVKAGRCTFFPQTSESVLPRW